MSDHARAKAIFLEVCGLPREERGRRIAILCEGNAALREEVESLLQYHESDAEDETAEPDGVSTAAAVAGSPPAELVPGEIVAGRYRISGLIGRGGMGSVYRADDTVLKIPVALKFFLSTSQKALERLINEVRLARRVTHPNVCQVFDAGEANGRHFIVMEYVRGEDLATLLRRIGRIPQDKALAIARQLCEGLAAAHGKSICHRDLKPANIMLDHEGNVKIMDFGIAASRDTDDGEAVAGGTPAYMAPEQLASAGTFSEKSDIYALGLVLYEALTGQPAYRARTIYQLAGLMTQHPPEPPSRVVTGIDPRIDRVIMAAIEPLPSNRPESALHLAAMLPGIDALRIAGQAGVTPPADLVARAPAGTSLHGRTFMINLTILVITLLAIWLNSGGDQRQLPEAIKPPEVMVEQARGLLDRAGYDAEALTSDFGYVNDPTELEPARNLLFWYQKIYPIDPAEPTRWLVNRTADDREEARRPVVDVVGAVFVMLRLDRTLRHLQLASIYPLKLDSEGSDRLAADWATCFREAGLNEGEFREVPAGRMPVLSDRVTRWLETECDDPKQCQEVQAATLQNRLTYFSLLKDIDKIKKNIDALDVIRYRQIWVYFPFQGGMFLLSLVLAIMHIRRKRCDLRGAFKLVVLLITATVLEGALRLGHVRHPSEVFGATTYDKIVFGPLFAWIFYVGLEPLARRHVPHVLIDWNKLLRWKMRDPGIGRSLLAGALGGAVAVLAGQLDARIAVWSGRIPFDSGTTASLADVSLRLRYALAHGLSLIPVSITFSIIALFFYSIIRTVVRRERIAISVFSISYGAFWGVLGYQSPWSFVVMAPIVAVLAYVILARRGLLAAMTAFWVVFSIESFPMTTDMLAWYAIPGLTGLMLAFAIGFTGLVLGSQSTDEQADAIRR